MFVKIAPDLGTEQVDVIAQALRKNGIDGVIATNTTVARDAVQGLPCCCASSTRRVCSVDSSASSAASPCSSRRLRVLGLLMLMVT